MDPITETQDSPVFGSMIGLLTGSGIDSSALENLQRRTTASARHSLWEGPDVDDDEEDISPRRRATRH